MCHIYDPCATFTAASLSARNIEFGLRKNLTSLETTFRVIFVILHMRRVCAADNVSGGKVMAWHI